MADQSTVAGASGITDRMMMAIPPETDDPDATKAVTVAPPETDDPDATKAVTVAPPETDDPTAHLVPLETPENVLHL